MEDELLFKLKKEFEQVIGLPQVEDIKEHRINIALDPKNLIDVANFLKHEMGFTIPNMCTGTDYKDKMEVAWHIGNPKYPVLMVLKVEIDRDNCVVESLTPIWEGMNWHERETYDLLGVKFENHPDLRRLLLPENWEGHPLREDYVYKRPVYRKPEDFE